MTDLDKWVQAWGYNAPEIVSNPWVDNLPEVPPYHDWMVTRDVTESRDEAFPTYILALVRQKGEDFGVLDRAKIDKRMYGEAGVLQRARAMAEEWFSV